MASTGSCASPKYAKPGRIEQDSLPTIFLTAWSALGVQPGMCTKSSQWAPSPRASEDLTLNNVGSELPHLPKMDNTQHQRGEPSAYKILEGVGCRMSQQ